MSYLVSEDKIKPKFICDNCEDKLKEKMDEDDAYIIENNVGGMSLMKHNNIKEKIILCETCFEEFKENLKEEEDWRELQCLDEGYTDYYDFEKLKLEILRSYQK